MFECGVIVENTWRVEHCSEDFPQIMCDCPFNAPVTCDGAWNCEDIYNITSEVMAYYDTNGDGSISLEDDIE